MVDKTKRHILDQQQNIKEDELKVDLIEQAEDDFEFKIAFDRSFYGKRSVSQVK